MWGPSAWIDLSRVPMVGRHMHALGCQCVTPIVPLLLRCVQVHSTIAGAVLPASTQLQSTSDVYSWLNGLLQVSWQAAYTNICLVAALRRMFAAACPRGRRVSTTTAPWL